MMNIKIGVENSHSKLETTRKISSIKFLIPCPCNSQLKSEDQLFNRKLKFIYSEKAIKFCEIFTLLLTNFVAFSEYMNFMWILPNIQKCFRFIGHFLRHVIWMKIKSLHQSLGFREVSSYLDKFLCQEMNMTTARQVRVEGNNWV